MKKFAILALTVALFGGARASWYWPFGSDEVDEKPKRISELVEPASLLIEEASDLAAEGKTGESIEKYRKALTELDRIEMENPYRAKSVEFATVRNKRAYVNAAIDSLLLNQVKSNARVVAVSDTAELERRLDRERWGKRLEAASAAIDRRDADKALTELESAKDETTNLVQTAITHGVVAGAYCQKGEFEKACRFLEMYRRDLVRTGVKKDRNALTAEERQLVSDNIQIIRDRVVGGYEKSFVNGRRVCEDSARLEALEDLTATNAVVLASNVVERLDALQKNLSVFAFPQARKLRDTVSDLKENAAEQFERMRDVQEDSTASTAIVWRLDVSGLKSELRDFRNLADRIEPVNRHLIMVMELVQNKKSVEIKSSASRKTSRTTGLPKPTKPTKPLAKREKVLSALSANDFTTASRLIDEMLVEKPNGAVALNLKAAMEARQGKLKEAEDTLDRAILSNPRNHFAYYNMARLMLQVRPDDKSVAKRYYETGRAFGGPVDAQLEEAFK